MLKMLASFVLPSLDGHFEHPADAAMRYGRLWHVSASEWRRNGRESRSAAFLHGSDGLTKDVSEEKAFLAFISLQV
jgi:hypothetical protein